MGSSHHFKCQDSKNNASLNWAFDAGRKHFPAFSLDNCGRLQAIQALLVVVSTCLTRQALGVRATREALGGHKVAPPLLLTQYLRNA